MSSAIGIPGAPDLGYENHVTIDSEIILPANLHAIILRAEILGAEIKTASLWPLARRL